MPRYATKWSLPLSTYDSMSLHWLKACAHQAKVNFLIVQWRFPWRKPRKDHWYARGPLLHPRRIHPRYFQFPNPDQSLNKLIEDSWEEQREGTLQLIVILHVIQKYQRCEMKHLIQTAAYCNKSSFGYSQSFCYSFHICVLFLRENISFVIF